VHITKIFLTTNVIDRQIHTKHNNIANFIHKYGQNKRSKRRGSINKEEVAIKHCTLIEWLNSLIVPSGVAICCNLPYDGTGEVKSQRSVFQKGKHMGLATNVYSRKTLEKLERGLRILKIRV